MRRERLIRLIADNLVLAAAAWIAAIAFPEQRFDDAGSARDIFAADLVFAERDRLLAEGQTQAAEALSNLLRGFRVPRRGMQARVDSGMKRALRSVATYGVYQRRQLMALESLVGGADLSASGLNQRVPSWTEIIRDQSLALKQRIALYATGLGSQDKRLAMKWLTRHLFRPHSAALPLVDGLFRTIGTPAACTEEGVRSWLLSAMREPSSWLHVAAKEAQQFRHRPYFRGGEPELMPECLLLPVWIVAGSVSYPHWVVQITERPSPRPSSLRKRRTVAFA